MLKLFLVLLTMAYARPNLDEVKAKQQIANRYSKIITGMKLKQPISADLKAAILQIETNPSLFIEKMFSSPAFFNIRVANFVSRLSNEENEPYQAIDDYQLALALAIQNNLDFRDIFTKPFYITQGGPTAVINNNILLEFYNEELYSKLNDFSLNFNPAAMVGETVSNGYFHDGLMSTQGFGLRFIGDGTNRHPIQAGYDMYMCSKIGSYKDASLNDMFVGPDISRNPGDNPNDYFEKCSTCHSVLDGHRGAFAYYDLNDRGRVEKYDHVINEIYNRNQQHNPEGEGYITLDTYWLNPLSSALNQNKFGWRTPLDGFGVLSFANMIVQSEQFQRCMTKKLIVEFCDQNSTLILDSNKEFISLYESMRADGYKMKNLISKIATSSFCVGEL